MEKKIEQANRKRLKVVIFGPESTGKTTLATQLSKHYNVPFVPEFARAYAEVKNLSNIQLTEKDVVPIAEGQLQLEKEIEDQSLLICDTDILETLTYARIYYPKFDTGKLTKYLTKNVADFYFLTYIDVPWKADGIRDLPGHRGAIFSEFETTLKTYNQPYTLLSGSIEKRFQTAVETIDKLLQNH